MSVSKNYQFYTEVSLYHNRSGTNDYLKQLNLKGLNSHFSHKCILSFNVIRHRVQKVAGQVVSHSQNGHPQQRYEAQYSSFGTTLYVED